MRKLLRSQSSSSSQAGPDQGTAEKVEFTPVDADLVRLAITVLSLAQKKDLSIVTAESCTGGLHAAVLSEAPGASTHLQGGFVTYTKAQKTVLDVPADVLQTKGAVNAEVARGMAQGALRHSTAEVAVAITGVAGPSRDEDGNPVGLVYFARLRRGGQPIEAERQFGDIGRGAIRYRAIAEAMALLVATLAVDPHVVTPGPGSRPAADSR
jgi:nicotinamide-nucleotide amidase